MSVIATLNIGANGATSLAGSSQGLSTPADRKRFLELHRSAGAIVIGRNTATSELYSKATVPIYLLTRDTSFQAPSSKFEVIHIVKDLSDVMREIHYRSGSPVVVEAGPSLLLPLMTAGCIDEVQISISPISGNDHYVDWREIMKDFTAIQDYSIDGTRLLQGRYQGHSAYR